MDKARLRDEAELALLAFLERGEKVARLPQSRAPVCVPVGWGRVGSIVPVAPKARLAVGEGSALIPLILP